MGHIQNIPLSCRDANPYPERFIYTPVLPSKAFLVP